MTSHAKAQWTNFGVWTLVALTLLAIFELCWRAMLHIGPDDQARIGLLIWCSLIGFVGAIWIGVNAMQANLRDFQKELSL